MSASPCKYVCTCITSMSVLDEINFEVISNHRVNDVTCDTFATYHMVYLSVTARSSQSDIIILHDNTRHGVGTPRTYYKDFFRRKNNKIALTMFVVINKTATETLRRP